MDSHAFSKRTPTKDGRGSTTLWAFAETVSSGNRRFAATTRRTTAAGTTGKATPNRRPSERASNRCSAELRSAMVWAGLKVCTTPTEKTRFLYEASVAESRHSACAAADCARRPSALGSRSLGFELSRRPQCRLQRGQLGARASVLPEA